jgi:hypothetical protein
VNFPVYHDRIISAAFYAIFYSVFSFSKALNRLTVSGRLWYASVPKGALQLSGCFLDSFDFS